jgi:hypothetical protein
MNLKEASFCRSLAELRLGNFLLIPADSGSQPFRPPGPTLMLGNARKTQVFWSSMGRELSAAKLLKKDGEKR